MITSLFLRTDFVLSKYVNFRITRLKESIINSRIRFAWPWKLHGANSTTVADSPALLPLKINRRCTRGLLRRTQQKFPVDCAHANYFDCIKQEQPNETYSVAHDMLVILPAVLNKVSTLALK